MEACLIVTYRCNAKCYMGNNRVILNINYSATKLRFASYARRAKSKKVRRAEIKKIRKTEMIKRKD